METRWLSADEQRYWRAWLTSNVLLQQAFERDLKATHGLSLAEYEILVRLSEAPDRQLRMSDLAQITLASRSRLSHQITRMEADGLVVRQECESDRRGFLAVLTERGWQRLVDAAPEHVESVRRHLVDVLTPEEFEQLGSMLAKVVAKLQPDEA